MANPTRPTSNQQKPGQAAKPTQATAPAKTEAPTPSANGEEKAKKAKKKRLRVRLVSTTVPGLWVRAYLDVVEKHGYPKDPNGETMVAGKAPAFGKSPEDRAAAKAEKEAEKKRIEAMSAEEKAAYLKDAREKRQAEQLAKKATEQQAMIARLKQEIADGKHGPLPTPTA